MANKSAAISKHSAVVWESKNYQKPNFCPSISAQHSKSMGWSNYQRSDIVNHRAGGRRRSNAERQARAWRRREEIKAMIGKAYMLVLSRGLQANLAEYFGVNRSTIHRDKEALLAEWRRDHVCPGCGTFNEIPLKTLARLAKRGIDVRCSTLGCRRVEEALEAAKTRWACGNS
jgi:hypothetical protein